MGDITDCNLDSERQRRQISGKALLRDNNNNNNNNNDCLLEEVIATMYTIFQNEAVFQNQPWSWTKLPRDSLNDQLITSFNIASIFRDVWGNLPFFWITKYSLCNIRTSTPIRIPLKTFKQFNKLVSFSERRIPVLFRFFLLCSPCFFCCDSFTNLLLHL